MKKVLIPAFATIAMTMASCNCNSCKTDSTTEEPSAIETIMTRTSVRQYIPDRPIAADTVEILLKAGMAAPTARNSQPWEFVVVNTREGLDSLRDASPHGKMLDTAPLTIVPCGNMGKTMKKAAHMMWVQDLSAASENILLAAHSLGLGAVWVGVFPIPERIEGVSKALQLPDTIIPLCIIPIGYPAGENTPKDKWNPECIHYNKY